MFFVNVFLFHVLLLHVLIVSIGLIERLSHVAGYSCVSDLNRKYLSKVLNEISSTCDMWESYSANFNIFIILLTQYAGIMLTCNG